MLLAHSWYYTAGHLPLNKVSIPCQFLQIKLPQLLTLCLLPPSFEAQELFALIVFLVILVNS